VEELFNCQHDRDWVYISLPLWDILYEHPLKQNVTQPPSDWVDMYEVRIKGILFVLDTTLPIDQPVMNFYRKVPGHNVLLNAEKTVVLGRCVVEL
jgi:hypothetical protein